MPALPSEAELIRFKTGRDESNLTNEIIDILFDEAEVTYASYSRKVVKQAVVVEVYRNLVASNREDVTYKQNETSENMSDISKGYAQDLAQAEEKLTQLIEGEKPVALRTAVMKKVPSRNRSFPNG